jgi:hypothetical protein
MPYSASALSASREWHHQKCSRNSCLLTGRLRPGGMADVGTSATRCRVLGVAHCAGPCKLCCWVMMIVLPTRRDGSAPAHPRGVVMCKGLYGSRHAVGRSPPLRRLSPVQAKHLDAGGAAVPAFTFKL